MARQKLNLTVEAETAQLIKETGINASRIAEAALLEAVKEVKEKQWLEENKEAVEAYNQHIEEHGVFGEKHGVIFNNEPI